VVASFHKKKQSARLMGEPRNQPNVVVRAHQYGDVDAARPSSMEAFPQSPGPESSRHVEFGDGSHITTSAMEIDDDTVLFLLARGGNLALLMLKMAESLNLHDSSNISRLPSGSWERLKWCHVARCPNLVTVFSMSSVYGINVWHSNSNCEELFKNLQHLHLRDCPRLRFVLPDTSFSNLRTLQVIHCGDLGHVFVLDDALSGYTNDLFPKLSSIHLRQSCSRSASSGWSLPRWRPSGSGGCFGLCRP
jgi:hypothetical protein